MCRSIKQLRYTGGEPTEEEIRAAALQYVRKVSGYRKPSRANQAAFDKAVADIASATRLLLESVKREVPEVTLSGAENGPSHLPALEETLLEGFH